MMKEGAVGRSSGFGHGGLREELRSEGIGRARQLHRDDDIERGRGCLGGLRAFRFVGHLTDLAQQQRQQLLDLYSCLLHRVAFAQGHRAQQLRLFAQRVEIDRDPERRAGIL